MMKRHEHALEQLRRLIDSGRYPIHSRLPAERLLAEELGVGRSTLRKSLSVLEAEGKIRRYVGQGTFVGDRPADVHDINQALADISSSPAEIIEVRLMLEPQIAGMAAVRASAEDIGFMHHCVSKSEAAPDWRTWELWDSTLHRSIADACKNVLLTRILEQVNSLRAGEDWSNLRERSLTPDWQRQLTVQHWAIVDAISRRESREAAEKMRQHLTTVQSNLLGPPDPLELTG